MLSSARDIWPPNALRQPLGMHLLEALSRLDVGGWAPVVRAWLDGPDGRAVVRAVEQRQGEGAVVYPGEVLRALTLTPVPSVRAVILGQDPYHGPGQAQGLAFSVPAGQRLPPSLRNILQEVRRDLGAVSPEAAAGDLQAWARQGVLLLNTALTVEDGRPGSHARVGWASLADALLRHAVEQALQVGRPLVLMLWGAHAQARLPLIQAADPQGCCLVLCANHPSPLAARRPPVPFVGCGHFSQAARFWAETDTTRPPVRW